MRCNLHAPLPHDANYFSVALYIYDYAITFSREVDLFWGRRFTGASLLFLLNRYLNLAHMVVEACNFAMMSDQVSFIIKSPRYLKLTAAYRGKESKTIHAPVQA